MTAAIVIVVVTTVYAAYALRRLTTIDTTRAVATRGEVLLGLNAQMGNNATLISAVLILLISVIALSVAIGVVRRRPGARLAAIGLFVALAAVSLWVGLGGVIARPPAPNAWYGVLTGVVDGLIVALLVAPATTQDFSRAELERRWLRDRGHLPGQDAAPPAPRGPGRARAQVRR